MFRYLKILESKLGTPLNFLKWNVSVLLSRQLIYLIFKHFKSLDQFGSCVRGENYLINVAPVGSTVRVGKFGRILLHLLL